MCSSDLCTRPHEAASNGTDLGVPMVTDNLGPQGRGFGTRGACGRLASGPTCQCKWPRRRLDRRLLGRGREKRPKYSFLFFYFHFSYLLSNSSFKFKPLLTSSIHQQLQHVSNYLTLFIYYYYYYYINYSIANALYTHKELLNFQEIHGLPN